MSHLNLVVSLVNYELKEEDNLGDLGQMYLLIET
ncbi:MAG: hypothetical protein ACI85O_000367 [Saprospiraceae bacterium]|jgi:hypothetical protein